MSEEENKKAARRFQGLVRPRARSPGGGRTLCGRSLINGALTFVGVAPEPEKQTDEIESLAAHWLELVREFVNAARDQRRRALVRKGERLINRINELAHDCHDLHKELQQSA